MCQLIVFWLLIYFLFSIKGNNELQLSVLWAGVWKDLAGVPSAVLTVSSQQAKMQLLLNLKRYVLPSASDDGISIFKGIHVGPATYHAQDWYWKHLKLRKV